MSSCSLEAVAIGRDDLTLKLAWGEGSDARAWMLWPPTKAAADELLAAFGEAKEGDARLQALGRGSGVGRYPLGGAMARRRSQQAHRTGSGRLCTGSGWPAPEAHKTRAVRLSGRVQPWLRPLDAQAGASRRRALRTLSTRLPSGARPARARPSWM